ncbi:MAG: Hsp20/alpha crystallin family protein [Alphaproteobacteria bacterium]|nr:Hsp20/alpha crystallin family protein [Alphaproteobacteria bacterium]QQS57492.1 MAG: Hsp20/alpha crystallin family protein [Alphaproteobacteria bacterium]
MNIEKWAPWNWFRHEQEQANQKPQGTDLTFYGNNPFGELHREMDRMFNQVFQGAGFPAIKSGFPLPAFSPTLLKPSVDISESEKSYAITAEVPGVEEKDVKIELVGNTLTISGEKKHEKEDKDKNWHRIERSYGSFKRVLSLPEDAVADEAEATFKNGILNISVPRKAQKKPANIRQIEIKKAS